MPIEDFIPGGGQSYDPSKRYLVGGSLLNKLLQRVECDPSQFDVKETPQKRIYTLRGPYPTSGSSSSTGVNVDFALFSCATDTIDFEDNPDDWLYSFRIMRIVIQDGIVVGFNENYTSERPRSENSQFQFIQDCCFIDDPPNDDWRA